MVFGILCNPIAIGFHLYETGAGGVLWANLVLTLFAGVLLKGVVDAFSD